MVLLRFMVISVKYVIDLQYVTYFIPNHHKVSFTFTFVDFILTKYLQAYR